MTILLSDVSDDLLRLIIEELRDSIHPQSAVCLSCTAKRLRELLRAQLLELRREHEEMKGFAQLLQMSCAELVQAEGIGLAVKCESNLRPGYSREQITLTDWEALCTLVNVHGLPWLKQLQIFGDTICGDQGIVMLSKWLNCRSLNSLTYLELCELSMGPRGADALAAAFGRGAMPSVCHLLLARNQLGDEGLSALAQPLRKLKSLNVLSLNGNGIGDKGLTALVLASLFASGFRKLEQLGLGRNSISDGGCNFLAAAISHSGRALPAIGRPQCLKTITARAWYCECSLAMQPLDLSWNPARLAVRYSVMTQIEKRGQTPSTLVDDRGSSQGSYSYSV